MRYSIGLLALAMLAVGCNESPAIKVPLPTNDPNFFAPPQEKSLPPETIGFSPEPLKASQLEPGEAAFVKAYQERQSPRIGVLVTRAIHSPITIPDGALETLAAQADGGDPFGMAPTDYDVIETQLAGFFSRSGHVSVKSTSAARARIERPRMLRIENGDVDSFKLAQGELQADILIRVVTSSSPTTNRNSGIHLTARATSIADGMYLGMASDDLPIPPTRSDINQSAYRLSRLLMDQMTRRFNGQNDSVLVQIFKAKSPAETALVQKFIQKTAGVTQVLTTVGVDTSANAVLRVTFNGPADEFLLALRDNEAVSKGIKVSDLTGNTINIDVEAPLELKAQQRKTNPATGKTEVQNVPVAADGG